MYPYHPHHPYCGYPYRGYQTPIATCAPNNTALARFQEAFEARPNIAAYLMSRDA
jgi:hypothetical protein